MTLLEQLTEDIKKYRKEGNAFATTLLSTLYSEASKVGKDIANRLPTDEELVTVAKKFMKDNEATIKLIQATVKDGLETTSNKLKEEISLIKQYVPKMLNEKELTELIAIMIYKGNTTLKEIMAKLKEEYHGMYDGKLASDIVKKILGKG